MSIHSCYYNIIWPILVAFLAVSVSLFNYYPEITMTTPAPPLAHSPTSRDHVVDVASIASQLVTTANPARSGSTFFDWERCAALHNFIVRHGWAAYHGRPLERGINETTTCCSWWEFHRRHPDDHQQDLDAIRGRLSPALAQFLEAVEVPDPPDFHDRVIFFHILAGLAGPGDGGYGMFLCDTVIYDEEDENRYVLLYDVVGGVAGHSVGLILDQHRNAAFMATTLWELEMIEQSAADQKSIENLWHPLETVLSTYIEWIRLGKVVALPPAHQDAKGTWGPPWTWKSYGSGQIDGAVRSFDALVAAIEARMPEKTLERQRPSGPLLTHEDLDAASVPKSECFVRSFLTRVRVPRFNKIAPGLLVPHDATSFAAQQEFAGVVMRAIALAASEDDGVTVSATIPPILMFPEENGRRADQKPSEFRFTLGLDFSVGVLVDEDSPSPISGLYSEAVHRDSQNAVEEGFRLILPFKVGTREHGAKRSDGSSIHDFDRGGSHGELFQHGFNSFMGDMPRTQRLERLFDRWREMVETGIWTVGADGVQGSIDDFREADFSMSLAYWIDPTW